jgi:hypothetical protein
VRCEISTAMRGKVILRPPSAAPMRSATVNGGAWTTVPGDSVTLLRTPAEVVFSTSSMGA